MKKSLFAGAALGAAILMGACYLPEPPPPPPPYAPPPPSRLQMLRARAAQSQQWRLQEQQRRWDEQKRAEEAAQQEALRQRDAEDHRRLLDAAERQVRYRAEQAEKEQQRAKRHAALAKMQEWAQAHLSWSFTYSASGRAWCTNAVDVTVPCDSAAARERHTETRLTASATAKNTSAVALSCGAIAVLPVLFGSGVIDDLGWKTLKRSSARWTLTKTFSEVPLWRFTGTCVVPLDVAATIIGNTPDELREDFPVKTPSDLEQVVLLKSVTDNRNAVAGENPVTAELGFLSRPKDGDPTAVSLQAAVGYTGD